MYGYVVVNKPELKFKEFDIYRSYYCGLCDELKERFGKKGQISISYDMTFLVLLLTGLYEPETTFYQGNCIPHPFHKHDVRRNEITGYVADMNVLMTYYKCIDDWEDEKKVSRGIFASALSKDVKRIEGRYPKKAEIIKNSLDKLSQLEKSGETNIDEPAKQFGRIMAQILLMRKDEWEEQLEKLGDALGRFIYILDAYDDLEKDQKKANYNVLLSRRENKDFDAFVEAVLKSLMAECARNFEILPIIENVGLLRNIIYSGVWTRFEIVKNKRLGKTGMEDT
ncbi:MAG: DUF5685 family protein [Eubacteriales bacterium]|nr:DUF5685 family protein [Eubacteriales bacterium]